MTDHPSRDTLADAAEGLLEPAEAATVDAHVAGCADCRAELAAFSEVSTVLAAAPSPTMPADVAARLAAVLATEQAAREVSAVLHAVPGSGPDAPPVPRHPYGTRRRLHPSLGHRFGEDLRTVSPGRRWAVPVLAAAAAALVLGFVAYVASATLGLNEPPAVSISTAPGRLPGEAATLRQRTDIDPHRFSQAWWCARRATDGDGRIVGLATTRVDDQPAVLVYVRTSDGLGVRVVTGCETTTPAATPWVRIGD
ncbi:zf-HC2 domain-containing protein [Microlunatus flavus]|uniref:Putative zinc-finger n=1 Tax=Microlunatus flavus TaxID=1036181 RepID=A0A1H9B6D9_9ACTN|nr:zf-HC2 domain-containing protein [Microlunatus flavus]SEP84592.1 Putative zinc-finger [Microlunatus flavus]